MGEEAVPGKPLIGIWDCYQSQALGAGLLFIHTTNKYRRNLMSLVPDTGTTEPLSEGQWRGETGCARGRGHAWRRLTLTLPYLAQVSGKVRLEAGPGGTESSQGELLRDEGSPGGTTGVKAGM